MGKRMLILACVMMVLFGSALSVSAEEIITPSTASYAYRIYADQGTIGPNYSEEWSYICEGTLTTNYQACFIFSEVYESEKYPEIKGQYEIKYYLPEYAVLGNANVVVGGSYEVKLYDKYSTKKGTLQEDKTVTAEFSGVNFSYVIGTDGTFSTSIPIFENEEDALAYFLYGDTSGMLNDIYDGMLEDNTFGLTGFTADNTITANWTGTTHDDVIDTYHKAKVGIRPAYSLKSYPGQIAKVGVVLQEYDIADKTFTKLYEELAPADDNLFLRYLEVIPNYQKEPLSSMYVGRSCWIYFNADGTIEKVVNDYERDDGDSRTDVDYGLELVDVEVVNAINPFDTSEKMIHWTGTTKDELIKEIGYTNTYVNVDVVVVNEAGEQKILSYGGIRESFPKPYIRQNIVTTSNSFNISPNEIDAYLKETDYFFEGEIRLEPHYRKNSVDYTCVTTVVNLYTKQVGTIDPDDPDKPIYDDDPEEPETDEEPLIPDVGDINDITDVIPWIIGVIKSFCYGVGQVPVFFSYLFCFFPAEVTYMLSLSLIVILFFRILGR